MIGNQYTSSELTLRQFIAEHNKEAVARAARLILDAANNLKTHPLLGRPVEEMPEYHDLVIPFGSAGYILRYRIEGEIIFILGIRHGKQEKLGQLLEQNNLYLLIAPLLSIAIKRQFDLNNLSCRTSNNYS